MLTPSQSVLTPEEIQAHPRFAPARAAFIDAVLAFHEGDQFSSRLMVETMRQVTFNLIVILHLRHDVTDRSTWPTPQRLKALIEPYGLASPRRIDALVARLVQLGYVDSGPSELDGRVRLLRPTLKMMALDREWLVYNYVPLRTMFPDSYSGPIARDPAFQRAQRLVALEFAAKSTQIMASNPSVMRFMHRDAGILVLIKLIKMSAGDVAKGVSYTDIGARFGVSRTHVRGLLEDAAQHGDVSLSGRGEPWWNLSLPSCKPSTASSRTPCRRTTRCTSSRANGWGLMTATEPLIARRPLPPRRQVQNSDRRALSLAGCL